MSEGAEEAGVQVVPRLWLHPPFLLRYLGRGVRLWAVSRLLVSAVFALAGEDPIRLPLALRLAIVALVTLIGVAEVWRRHERALLDNLGIEPWVHLGLVACAALSAETLVAVLFRVAS